MWLFWCTFKVFAAAWHSVTFLEKVGSKSMSDTYHEPLAELSLQKNCRHVWYTIWQFLRLRITKYEEMCSVENRIATFWKRWLGDSITEPAFQISRLQPQSSRYCLTSSRGIFLIVISELDMNLIIFIMCCGLYNMLNNAFKLCDFVLYWTSQGFLTT